MPMEEGEAKRLVEQLRDGDDAKQAWAADELAELADSNTECQAAIREAGAIELLVRMARSISDGIEREGRIQAKHALKELVADADNDREIKRSIDQLLMRLDGVERRGPMQAERALEKLAEDAENDKEIKRACDG